MYCPESIRLQETVRTGKSSLLESDGKESAMERNKGLSLVELLITIAILSIVMVIAVSFMMTGSRSFTKGNADSTVQKEAELTVNQIEDMIIDINGGVSMTDDANKTEMTMYHTEDDGTGTMRYTKSAVMWNKSNNNMYCSKWKVNYDSTTGTYTVDTAAAENYEDQLLAEHVTSFDVDLSDTLTTKALDGTTRTVVKSVLIKVGYDDGTGIVDYATSPIITLRNRMLLSDDPANIFDESTPMADTLKLYYTGVEILGIVPIKDRDSEVQRGSAYNIYARISTGADVNDLVDWEIEETGTVSTIDDTGYLSVGAYEANAYLTITAKYKSDPNRKATGVVKVMGDLPLKSLDAVHITTRSLEPFAPKYGSFPSTTGFTDSEIAAITYEWKVRIMDQGDTRDISEVVESFTNNNKTLDLTIKKDSLNYGKLLEIELKAHSDLTGQTVSDKVIYRIDNEGTVGGDSNMERAKIIHGDTYFSFDTQYAEDVSAEYYFCDIYGNRLSAYDNLLDCVELEFFKGSRITYRLSFKESLPRNQSYYVKLIFRFYDQGTGARWSYERIHDIPAVQLFGRTCYSNTTLATNRFIFSYAVEGYYEVAWANSNPPIYEYSIADFEYEAPAGVVVTPLVEQTYVVNEATMNAEGKFDCSDWSQSDQVILKSLKIKISMKDTPEIYTYTTIIFE